MSGGVSKQSGRSLALPSSLQVQQSSAHSHEARPVCERGWRDCPVSGDCAAGGLQLLCQRLLAGGIPCSGGDYSGRPVCYCEHQLPALEIGLLLIVAMATGVLCGAAGGRVYWTSSASATEIGCRGNSCQDTARHCYPGERVKLCIASPTRTGTWPAGGLVLIR